MKKLSLLLLSLMAMTMFTGCNEDSENSPAVRELTARSLVNCLAVDEEGRQFFSQDSATMNYLDPDMIVHIRVDYKDVEGRTHTYTSPSEQLKLYSGSVYSIAEGNAPTMHHGFYDMATGMLFYNFHDGASTVFMMTQPLYAYVTTTVSNVEGSASFSHQQSAYQFLFDSKCETCTLQISNFIPDTNGTVQMALLEFKGLTLTRLPRGYEITGDGIRSTNGNYTVRDLSITLGEEGAVINGTYSINLHPFRVQGSLFPTAN